MGAKESVRYKSLYSAPVGTTWLTKQTTADHLFSLVPAPFNHHRFPGAEGCGGLGAVEGRRWHQEEEEMRVKLTAPAQCLLF